jgi:hypothetical protein
VHNLSLLDEEPVLPADRHPAEGGKLVLDIDPLSYGPHVERKPDHGDDVAVLGEISDAGLHLIYAAEHAVLVPVVLPGGLAGAEEHREGVAVGVLLDHGLNLLDLLPVELPFVREHPRRDRGLHKQRARGGQAVGLRVPVAQTRALLEVAELAVRLVPLGVDVGFGN